MKDFRVREGAIRVPDPAVTLVKIDLRRRGIYVGTMPREGGTLTALDAQGRATGATHVASRIARLRTSGDTLSLLLMGSIHPSDAPRGSHRTVVAGSAGADRSDTGTLVSELRRPVHASYGDRREDVVLSEFGHFTGRLAWHQNLGGGSYRADILKPAPGALTTFVRDADGDGRLDVVALFAQGDEGVYLFRNTGGGRFVEERLVRLPPSLGSTSLDIADMNGDGHWDLVHASGDNGDYPPRAKPYHGIRVFLNDGHDRFEEGFFFPFHGASKVVARDFDGDGRADNRGSVVLPGLQEECS